MQLNKLGSIAFGIHSSLSFSRVHFFFASSISIFETDATLAEINPLVITGEGSFDQQTFQGKVPLGVAKRAAAMNIIPTTTGAAKAVTLAIPELKGRIHGLAFRIPTPIVSVVDFVADLEKEATVEQINRAFKAAADGPLAGILEYCQEPLVSMDFKGNPASSILDALSTMVIGGNMVKVLAWYDNEWGFSCRLADLATYIANKGL